MLILVSLPQKVLRVLKPFGISILDRESVLYFENVVEQVLNDVAANEGVSISLYLLISYSLFIDYLLMKSIIQHYQHTACHNLCMHAYAFSLRCLWFQLVGLTDIRN